MATLPYTKAALIERIKKQLVGDFPGQDFKITTSEVLLLVDAAIPFVMKSQMFENAKITGFLETIEAYLMTYELPITLQDSNTLEWYVTLPQTPLELPTGYDITRTYVASPSTGASKNGFPIKAKRVSFREYMPVPGGFFYRLEGSLMYLKTSDGSPLSGYDLFVQMPISRTADVNAPMNMPDGAIEPIFNKVVATLIQRFQIPKDTVLDNLPAGNKSS
jgi:hypothetical protein